MNRTNSGIRRNNLSFRNVAKDKSKGTIDIPRASDDVESHGFTAEQRRNAQNAAARRNRGGNVMCSIGFLLTFVLVASYSLVSYQERELMKNQLKEQDTTMRELEIDLSMQFDSKIKKLADENALLHKKVTDEKELKILNQQLLDKNKKLEMEVKSANERNQDQENSSMQLREMQQKVQNLEQSTNSLGNYKTMMIKNVKYMSRMALLEKFGPGPHQVEIVLRFDSHQGNADRGVITIEMAPIDELPHVTYWFLEQVSRKLYDGCSFHRNAGHVIQGGPVPNFLSPGDANHERMNQKFINSGFHSILFQEYSHTFPHTKYTLGFAGRPGGPEFYISTQDNTKNHGPGGQGDPHEADACFAKVVDGFDVVDRMHNSEVKPGEYHAMASNVAIEWMKIKQK